MKIKTLLIPAISLVFCMYSCKSAKVSDCIDESRISDGPCTMEYNPVCGCNGKTYGNACMAARDGVTSWSVGGCN